MYQDENTSTSMVDENTTSTYRLQKVLVERTCSCQQPRKLQYIVSLEILLLDLFLFLC